MPCISSSARPPGPATGSGETVTRGFQRDARFDRMRSGRDMQICAKPGRGVISRAVRDPVGKSYNRATPLHAGGAPCTAAEARPSASCAVCGEPVVGGQQGKPVRRERAGQCRRFLQVSRRALRLYARQARDSPMFRSHETIDQTAGFPYTSAAAASDVD